MLAEHHRVVRQPGGVRQQLVRRERGDRRRQPVDQLAHRLVEFQLPGLGEFHQGHADEHLGR